ncbi:hypothetical protein ACRRTK_016036 [Alexandromys fortis]
MCVPLSRTPCVCTLLWHGAVAVGVDVYKHDQHQMAKRRSPRRERCAAARGTDPAASPPTVLSERPQPVHWGPRAAGLHRPPSARTGPQPEHAR